MTGAPHEGVGQSKPPSAPVGAKGLAQTLKEGQGASMTSPSTRSVPSSPKTGAKYHLFFKQVQEMMATCLLFQSSSFIILKKSKGYVFITYCT